MDRRARLALLALYGLFFLAELGQSVLVPLVPVFAREFSLSGVQSGAILSAATLATVVASVPVGLLADRVGALPLALAAGILLCVAALVQALAADFTMLLLGRVAFGLAFATVWTAGIALLLTSRAGAVGGAITVGGLAHLVGPPLSGYLTELVGRALPFLVIACAGLGVCVLVAATAPSERERAPRRRSDLGAAARAVRHEPVLGSAVVLIALVGTTTGVVPLVVPLLLDERGFSSADIGLVFAAGSTLWVLASALAVRAGRRAVSVSLAGAGLLALGAVAVVPFVVLVVPCLIGFVLLRASLQAPLSTINYVLGEDGARAAGVSTGAVLGLLNLVWGVGGTLSPLVAGGIVEEIGARWVFLLLACVCLVAGVWMRWGPPSGGRASLPWSRRRRYAPA